MTKLIITLRKPEDSQVVQDTGCEVLAEYPNSLLVRCTNAQRDALKKVGIELTELAKPIIQISGASFSLENALKAEKAAPASIELDRTAYYLLLPIGPVKGEWITKLRSLGGTMHGNLKNFTLLIGILPSKINDLKNEPWVETITPYRPTMKISHKLNPKVGRVLSTSDLTSYKLDEKEEDVIKLVEISVFQGESTADIAAIIREGGGSVAFEKGDVMLASVPMKIIKNMANQQGVRSIVPYKFPKLHNNRAAEIMEVPSDGNFNDLTLRGKNQTVAIADSGIDTGNSATIHDDFSGRISNISSTGLQPEYEDYITNPTPYDDGPSDTHGHGTHVAGSVLGNGAAAQATTSTTIPQGIAPEAQVYFQALYQTGINWKSQTQLQNENRWPPPWWEVIWGWPPPSEGVWLGIPFDINNLFLPAYQAGVRIHTNSWGAPLEGEYTENSRVVDDFMWNHRDMLILYSTGNEGIDDDSNGIIDEDSVGSPGTAKNCLTVGASENNRPHGSIPTPGYDIDWTDWPKYPQMGDAGHVSDVDDGMAAFSSRGPTDDGRTKPDVVAPGTNILSTKSSVGGSLWGDLSAGPPPDPLLNLYCWCGGTSMSTPLTAGAAAIIREHLTQHRGHNQNGVKPSGALIKAFIINGAEPMHPGQFTKVIGTNQIPEIPEEPNDVNGFGRTNLRESLIPSPLGLVLFADEPDYAVETGQIRPFEVVVIDTNRPLKATLVWTDAPGQVGIGGLQNQLYLQVRRPDGIVVDGDITPYPNTINNVQKVVINNPAAGTYEIRVRGVSVTQQAPGASTGINPRQDFALVVSNGMGFSLQPVSVAQAIDTTGSMGYFGYMDPAKERAKQLVDFMRINDKVSITEFSKRTGVINLARNVYPLHLLGSFSPDWTDAHTAIDGLHSEGRTPIGAGLQEAWNQLSPEPSSQPRAIVLLSDGYNNEPPDPSTVLPTIPTDVPIFTVALGPAANSTTLQNIANSRPSGSYYVVESDEDVHKLHEIYAQIQALAAGATIVALSSAEMQSQKPYEIPVEPDVEEATFALSWDEGLESKMELIVKDPDGNPYNTATAATIERKGSAHHLVRVSIPKPGMWSLLVINHDSTEHPVKYTLSTAVQSRLTLSVETPKLREKYMMISARLLLGNKPVSLDDTEVLAQLTIPTRSRKEILDENGKQIQQIQLPKEVNERGLNKEQILNLKLAVFAQKYRKEKGGLYRRETFEVKLSPRGDGTWTSKVPINNPGNVTIDIIARGKIHGMAWQRYKTQSVYVPARANGCCLIAAVAGGSTLNPQVQFLRQFRDEVVLESKFKNLFKRLEDFYYKFSPSIVRKMEEIPHLQKFIKYLIVYPFVSSTRAIASIVLSVSDNK